MDTKIQAGKYVATLTRKGAALVSLKFEDLDLVVPQSDAVMPRGYHGQVMVPWPGRLADATYSFEGETYGLEVSEPATGSALHGLGAHRLWQLRDQTDSDATYSLRLGGDEGYPFPLQITAAYSLDAQEGLRLSIEAVNTGERDAPYAVAAHPYISCNLAPIEDCELTVPAAQAVAFDDRKLPVGLVEIGGTDLDFTAPRLVKDQQVDHAFLAEMEGGAWTATLSHRGTGLSVDVTSDEKWIQVFTADGLGRNGVAIEPMSAPGNAFNTGQDLTVLEPGQSHIYEMVIRRGVLPASSL